jgi:3'-phosphoadenosine 5'-phosphosulfate (PAPS) 3'-phosphatase
MSAASSSAASSALGSSSKHEDDGANAVDASAVNATVNLLELASAAVACTVSASRKITALSSLYKDSNMNARLKSDGSFVTDADFAAQGAIVQAIQRVSQYVRIVGEESAEEMAAHIDDDDAEDIGGVDNEADHADAKADHDDDNDDSGGDNDAPGDNVDAAHAAASTTTTNKGRKRRLQQLEQQQKRQQQQIIDRDILERTRSEVRYRLFYQKANTSKKDGPAQEGGGGGGTDDITALPLSPAPPSTTTTTTAESTTASDAPAAAATSPTPFVPLQFSSDDPDECTVDAARVSVIVDPLDGTKSYAHGDYDAVSILVGIVVDNIPIFGVVGKPFGYTGLPPIRDTGCVTIYGGPLLGGVYVAGRLEPIVRTPIRLEAAAVAAAAAAADTGEGTAASSSKADAAKAILLKDLPRAVISSSRSEGVVQDFCVHLGDRGLIDPEPLLISGAGEKSLRLILQKNNEALWFFPKGGTSRWDVAAPDALLRSLGGRMSDKYGNDLDYSTSRDDAENVDGIVACIDAELHAECIRLFGEGDWGTRK